MFSHFQNARQTKCPEEFVDSIHLEIPTGAAMDNPATDAVLLERIGARRINHTAAWASYELTNAATGTWFTFDWLERGSLWFWALRRGEFLMPDERKNMDHIIKTAETVGEFEEWDD